MSDWEPRAIRLWDEREMNKSYMDLYLLDGMVKRSCVIICPGGGYASLSDHEGAPIALWLNGIGISACVLKYQVAPHRHPQSLNDVKRALRLVRAMAHDWGIDPNRIGIMGFSAGGHLAAIVATQFDLGDMRADDPVDRQSCRPDFMVLAYPVISFTQFCHLGSIRNLVGDNPDVETLTNLSAECTVTRETPSAFIWFTSDDESVDVRHGLLFASALRKCQIPFELHVFEHGEHGVGLATGELFASNWTAVCGKWLKNKGLTEV